MKRGSHFAHGSGVYTCRVCGHNTRDTGGDGVTVKLCEPCWELAGYENQHSDDGGLELADLLQVARYIKQINARGGDWTKAFDVEILSEAEGAYLLANI